MAEGTAPVKPKKNWFVRHKILTALLVIIVLVILGSALGGGSSNNNDNSSNKSSNSASKASNEKAASVAKLNQPARDGKFEFTVTSFTCGETTVTSPDSAYLSTSAQGQFCEMKLSVKNIGTVQQSFYGGNQYVYNATGTQYSYSGTATIYANPSGSQFSSYEDVNPGVTVNGTLEFDVPKGTTPTYAMLHDSSASNGVRVNLQ